MDGNSQMGRTEPGKKWEANNPEKRLVILEALLQGRKRYMEIWNHVRPKIGNKNTFQLYLAKLEEQGVIKRRKLSHKRVEFELLYLKEERDKLEKKLCSMGLIDTIRELNVIFTGPLEGSLEQVYSHLDELLVSSMPRWIGNIDFSSPSLFISEPTEKDRPSVVLLFGKEFANKTICELDDQFFSYEINELLKRLLCKFMMMRMKIQHGEIADKVDWLRKALDFEAVIAFNLPGRRLIEKLDMKEIGAILEKAT
jgi:DNA-binding HxlR family transcriptional regulator